MPIRSAHSLRYIGGLSVNLNHLKIELMEELENWNNKSTCTLKELQKLIGKLQFVCAVIRPGRLFLARMLELLRSFGSDTSKHTHKTITTEFVKDIKWWKHYLPQFSGTSLLWMYHIITPDKMGASDACLKVMGAVVGKEYIKVEFLEEWKGKNIAYLELLAVIVMCKTWIHVFTGKSVVISSDNEAITKVLNTGKARDSTLLMLMREMIFVAAGKFEFRAKYLPGRLNILPDLLSRWHEGSYVHHKFNKINRNNNYTELKVAPDVFNMTHLW